LSRLLRLLIQDRIAVNLALIFFAVFQAPQEAVMWLAAMNETTLAFFTLLTLLLWWNERPVLATISYSFALFSKESAILIPVLILLLHFYKERTLFRRSLALLLIPTAVFGAIFLRTISNNFMLTNHSYSFGSQAIFVLAKTLHRLHWPWAYVVLILVWCKDPRLPSLSTLASYLGRVALAMTPYMFIAYQNALPSRQLYLSSAVLMTVFGLLLRGHWNTTALKLF